MQTAAIALHGTIEFPPAASQLSQADLEFIAKLLSRAGFIGQAEGHAVLSILLPRPDIERWADLVGKLPEVEPADGTVEETDIETAILAAHVAEILTLRRKFRNEAPN